MVFSFLFFSFLKKEVFGSQGLMLQVSLGGICNLNIKVEFSALKMPVLNSGQQK